MKSFDFESFRLPPAENEITATVTDPAPEEPAVGRGDLEIPAFLQRNKDNTLPWKTTPSNIATAALAAASAAASSTNPLATATGAASSDGGTAGSMPEPTTEPTTEQLRIASNKRRKNVSLAKLRMRKEAEAARDKGFVWKNGRYEDPHSMGRADYQRILAQMDTPEARRLFVHQYSEKVR